MKMNLLRKFAPLVLGVALIAGCASLKDTVNDQGLVITAPEFVAPGDALVTVKVADLPEDILAKIPEELQDEELVVVDKDLLSDDVPFVPILAGRAEWEAAMDDPNVTAGFFDAIMAILLSLFPALAAWEGMLILLFRRKRDHWINFVKKVLPWANKDAGDVNLGSAFLDVLKAVGGLHSSEATEAVFEEEKLEVDED
jgi:hypothetical protein